MKFDQLQSSNADPEMVNNGFNKPYKPTKKYWFLGGFFVLVIILQITLVRFDLSQTLPASVQNYIYLPAVIINYRQIITMSDIYDQDQAMAVFSENTDSQEMGLGISFKNVNERRHIAQERIIRDLIIANLVKQFNIEPTEDEISKEWGRLISTSETENKLLDSIKKYLGLSKEQYRDLTLLPSLREIKLHQYYHQTDSIDSENKKIGTDQLSERINQAREAIKKGEDFAQVATRFSDDPQSAFSGGDLGWQKMGERDADFEGAVFSLAIGEVSNPIKTDFGYYIAKIEDKKIANSEVSVKVRQIVFLPDDNFENWLDGEVNSTPIWRLTKY
ncbi:MAG: hypothetical protein ACD_12C00726G0002 [uncultured bacterium]|nr:MAG: hypothetical protein ACD_12C00726G0002 [uncultured bacterium]